jgi:DNA-binding beta-propeller fold protein YncE
VVLVLAAGCGGDPARHTPDGHAIDTHAADTRAIDAPADAMLFDASDPNSTVLIAQSPPGTNPDTTTWGGVLQFQVAGDGSALVAGAGIPKTSVEDPIGLAFKAATSEVFVGNRHGNSSADGVAGSISRFTYTQATHALVAQPEITGNGLQGVHQVAFSPTTGELFAANRDSGVSRFTFDGSGNPVANGTIASGPTRGVFVAPDGRRLYVSTASSVIRQFDLSTGTELTAVTLSTAGNLHFFAVRTGDLYVAALDDNKVYRYAIAANDDLTFVQAIDATSPVGVAFSADGMEMYVTGHMSTDVVQRYAYDASTDTWIATGSMDLGSSLGGIVILPG